MTTRKSTKPKEMGLNNDNLYYDFFYSNICGIKCLCDSLNDVSPVHTIIKTIYNSLRGVTSDMGKFKDGRYILLIKRGVESVSSCNSLKTINVYFIHFLPSIYIRLTRKKNSLQLKDIVTKCR